MLLLTLSSNSLTPAVPMCSRPNLLRVSSVTLFTILLAVSLLRVHNPLAVSCTVCLELDGGLDLGPGGEVPDLHGLDFWVGAMGSGLPVLLFILLDDVFNYDNIFHHSMVALSSL